MKKFMKAAKVTDIPDGKMKEFTVNGTLITIAHIDGEFFAFDGLCTHAHCSLSGGFLDGHAVTCYCHGGQFDISTGEVLAPPPQTPLNVYSIKIDKDDILVEV